ncbi:MAG: hypothetical protein P1V13_16820 [Rhizobiaceae bacterium]|nr:hypothetical protein [Rhizobiaceae bacterium]
MTMIIDHSTHYSGINAADFVKAVLKRLTSAVERARRARRARRADEMLLAMSSHDLRDIGIMRGDIAFGISSGRSVFGQREI